MLYFDILTLGLHRSSTAVMAEPIKAELILDNRGITSEGPAWDERKGVLRKPHDCGSQDVVAASAHHLQLQLQNLDYSRSLRLKMTSTAAKHDGVTMS